MKLIRPYFEILEQKPRNIIIPADMVVGPKMAKQELIDTVYRQIEIAGRHCYKSLDKITPDSAKGFVDRLIKSGHGSMLEHGTVYLAIPMTTYAPDAVNTYRDNAYSKVNDCDEFIFTDKYGDKVAAWCVTTNLRVLVENDCLEDLEFLCEPTEYHVKRVTVKFITDQGILREFTRHRTFSFAVESTRYCNYSKEKFNNEITFILPCWMSEEQKNMSLEERDTCGNTYAEISFKSSLVRAEKSYFTLLEEGWKPQQARNVLPLATKCEMIMTGFVDDWWGEYLVFDKSTGLLDQRIHGMFWKELDNIDREKYRIVEKGFFPLRCSNAAHPQARELAIPLREEFIKKKIL